MKTLTIANINTIVAAYLPANWSGTALDMLRLETMPTEFQLWVVLQPEILDEKTLRLFAVWCARSAQHLMKDPRSIEAIDVAEKFANGNATGKELESARMEAWETMITVAGAQATLAAVEAAWSAVALAAHVAAWSATESSADTVAFGAARKQFRKEQVAQLIKMLS